MSAVESEPAAEVPEALRSVSATRFDMGLKCGYQFFRRYVLGEKKPPTAALAFGRADDETKNVVYDHKIATSLTLAVDECQEVFAAKFDEQAEEVEDWKADKPAVLKDTGVRLIHAWHNTCAVATRPVLTQKKFKTPITYRLKDGGSRTFEFEGVLDLVEDVETVSEEFRPVEKRVITDNKTSAKKWGKRRVEESTQALFYGVAAERDEDLIALGVDPGEMHFHVAVKTKVPQVQCPSNDPDLVRRTDGGERQGAMKKMALFHQAVEANMANDSFLPNRSHMMCSRRWCGWWQDCEKAFGGKVRE